VTEPAAGPADMAPWRRLWCWALRSPTCWLLFAVAWWADRARRGPLSVIGNAWVYALSMACTARPGPTSAASAARPRRRVVPAHLPGPDAGHGAGLAGAAQDDPHRAHLAHHLDRRLHRQPLRQEPGCWPAGDADRAGRHGALRRAAAQGDGQRLCAADRPAGTPPRASGPWWRATARCTSRWRWPASPSPSAPATSTPPSATKAWSRPSLRIGGQAAGLPGGRRLRHLGAVRRPGRPVRPALAQPELAPAADAGGQALRLRPVVRAARCWPCCR
jgi:hypothetical protein